MKIINQEIWEKGLANNRDPYGSGVYRYAEAWANLMEERMQNGASLEEVAKQASHDADEEGITGFMYGAAVHTLSHVWEHGEELRRWHNKEYDQPEATGTVNPAVMIIGEKP